jgi:DNA helicase II / ATP-dependent DNA helicase PcrA
MARHKLGPVRQGQYSIPNASKPLVVGDGDQSIFKFRGAESRNADRLAEDFKEAQTVTLVESYRSKKCVVEASQAAIEKNRNRPEKKMKTSKSSGDRVTVVTCEDQNDEVYTITRRLRELVRLTPTSGISDVSVLYRTKAQSRPFEEAFVKASIPYRPIGGTRKDLLAYMRVSSGTFWMTRPGSWRSMFLLEASG